MEKWGATSGGETGADTIVGDANLSQNSSQSFIQSSPSINLPKEGEAIRGIGEKFSANQATGTGSMSVPIAISPGRSGFGPQLSLSSNSGAGNDPLWFRLWSLSLPSITRKTDKGLPRYIEVKPVSGKMSIARQVRLGGFSAAANLDHTTLGLRKSGRIVDTLRRLYVVEH